MKLNIVQVWETVREKYNNITKHMYLCNSGNVLCNSVL